MGITPGLINLDDTTPAAPAGKENVKWQAGAPFSTTITFNGQTINVTARNVSAYVDPTTVNGSLGVVIDGGGIVPATGSKGYFQVPYDCVINSWTMLANASGSAQITVKKSTYSGFPTTASIVASAPPNLTAAQKATTSTLTGWTTALAKGDILEFNLDSIVTITRVILQLLVTRSD